MPALGNELCPVGGMARAFPPSPIQQPVTGYSENVTMNVMSQVDHDRQRNEQQITLEQEEPWGEVY